jgi:hypothetical protein
LAAIAGFALFAALPPIAAIASVTAIAPGPRPAAATAFTSPLRLGSAWPIALPVASTLRPLRTAPFSPWALRPRSSLAPCLIALAAGPFDGRLIALTAGWLVALAAFPLRAWFVLVAAEALGESPAFFITRDLESRARILVRSARPPSRPTPFAAAAPSLRLARLLRRLPEAAAREPHHHRVWMTGLQLLQRGCEFFLRRGAERRRLPFENDRPVGMAGRHRFTALARVA